MNNRTARACDGCRVRKVKCNSAQPCSQCSHLGLTCVFSPLVKRKPSVRNRLVAQLRDKTNTHVTPAGCAPNTPLASPPAVTSIAGIVNSEDGASTVDLLLSWPPGSVYDNNFFLSLLPKYEAQVYPVSPIMTSGDVRNSIANMDSDPDDEAFVYAYAAVTINLSTPTSWTLHGETGAQTMELSRRSVRTYRQAESLTEVERGKWIDLPLTFKRIMTCIFLEVSMISFKRYDRAIAFLREAMTMMQLLHVRQDSHSGGFLAPRDVPKFQRLYWEMFIHERFLTTLTGIPCIMPSLPTGLPQKDVAIPPHIDMGFSRLISIFRIMDGPFLFYWTAQQNPAQPVAGISAQWIESKQAQLDRDEADAAEVEMALKDSGRGLTELQHVDLYITRVWLRTLLWQFGLTHGFLRSAPPQNTHEGLSIHFPASRLSVQLRNLVSRLESLSSIVTHGSGIVQKIFEITSTVADVLALPLGYGQTQEDVRERIEDFAYLVKFLFSFETSEKEQRDYLREKLDVLQQKYTIVDFADLAGPSPDV